MANLSPGNFIEIGSGSRTSNTFLLERTNNWTGLLVEPDERSFATYLSCHRNVSLLNSCISRDQYVERTNFILHKGGGSRATYSLPKRYLPGFKHVAETCFPLYSIMLAINRTNIGVLSLKSGYEEDAILASLPWDKVNISLVAVPVTHFVDRGAAVRKTLTRNNYEVVALAMGKFDIIAVKKPELLSLKSGYEEDAILASLPWDKVNISLVAVPVTHFVDRGAAVRKTLTRNNYEVVALAMGKFDIIAVKKPERKP
ncbi:hypothetical protein TCAL_10568 [Tigriopus californicus]|uniref:Methyltransferase FkbM domain-containing protein n=1 Tax=Tigriopus californicus TaxID=6832 RepID=A0A553PHS3_TIGCA|nr:hypothetical protein TCAL_10568 [Tigriopus californicus]